MQNTSEVQEKYTTKMAREWLWLAVLSLGVAGIYSILLVLGRAPVFQGNFLGVKNFFSVALVAHVDLSVLVWFIGMSLLLMVQVFARSTQHWLLQYSQRAVWLCIAASALCMALAPWATPAEVIKSNYVPVLANPVFYLGLGLLFAGVGIAILLSFLHFWLPAAPQKPTHIFGVPFATMQVAAHSMGGVLLLAMVAQILTAPQVQAQFGKEIFFEQLFWASGHILQFLYTQLVMVCWLILAAALGWSTLVEHRFMRSLLWLNLAAATLGLLAFAKFPVIDAEFTSYFTDHMRHYGGIASGLMAVILLVTMGLKLDTFARHLVAWTGLLVSILLFGFGGGLGFAIAGANVTIPAHYHGAIVAVTLATMGAVYALLQQFGAAFDAHSRLAQVQLWLYAVGQLMHVGGLAWSGGYGVLRKTPGGLDAMPAAVKVAMGIMGLGGLLAIIGGLIFVVLVVKALRK